MYFYIYVRSFQRSPNPIPAHQQPNALPLPLSTLARILTLEIAAAGRLNADRTRGRSKASGRENDGSS